MPQGPGIGTRQYRTYDAMHDQLIDRYLFLEGIDSRKLRNPTPWYVSAWCREWAAPALLLTCLVAGPTQLVRGLAGRSM